MAKQTGHLCAETGARAGADLLANHARGETTDTAELAG
jgi:hypothetical protein